MKHLCVLRRRRDGKFGHYIIIRITNLARRTTPTFHTFYARYLKQVLLDLADTIRLTEVDGHIAHKVLHELIHHIAHRIADVEDCDKNGSSHGQSKNGQK